MEPGGREHHFYIEDKKRFMVYYKILPKQWNRAEGKANTNRHEFGRTNLCPKTTDESSRALSLETLRQKPPTRAIEQRQVGAISESRRITPQGITKNKE